MASTRRNGLPSSCEPCRKSKLRCDHSTPVCGRCSRRRNPDLCVYHPAPLTQDTGLHQQKRKRRRNDNDRDLSSAQFQFPTPSSAETPEGSFSDSAYPTNWNQKKPSFATPGFMGLTSYSAVFAEHGNCVGANFLSSGANDTVTANPKQLQVGAQILLLLSQEISLYEKIFETRFKIFQGWTLGLPIVQVMLKSVRNTLDHWLSGGNDANPALTLAGQFFENGAKSVDTHPDMTLSEYISSISNRWETIGVLFSLTGLATSLIPFDDPVWKRADPKSFANQATAVGDICLQFCDYLGTVNDPLIWLLLHHTAVLSLVYGDSDYRPWKKLGELSTAVFALGLHQEPDPSIPFFLKEIRKRIMIGAFAIDKQLATFLGRPPLIGWRYCDIQFPLDLSYDEIIADSHVRDTAIARLEENNGWNAEGNPSKGGWAWTILISTIFREKVLELSLCRRVDDLGHKVEDLSKESHQMRSELPEFLRWKPERDSPLCPHDDNVLFSLHLDFLYSEFLLYRILDRRNQTQSDGLINASQEILSALHLMIAKKNRARRPLLDIGWILCYVCLPAAGVLAIELLHRSQPRLQPAQTTPFPRSEIIQNLSIFASYLESMVEPSEGNYEISQQGRNAIRHVLDRVLSEPVTPLQTLDTAMEMPAGSLDANAFGDTGLGDGMQFLQWLDNNVDYRQESWVNWLTFS